MIYYCNYDDFVHQEILKSKGRLFKRSNTNDYKKLIRFVQPKFFFLHYNIKSKMVSFISTRANKNKRQKKSP